MPDHVWEIRIDSHTTWAATFEGRKVELAYPPTSTKHKLEITWHRSTQIHTFDLSVGGQTHSIVVRSLSTDQVDASPETVSAQLTGTGFSIGIEGVGTAAYSSKTIVSSVVDDEWEEALMWLVGTLSIINFPHMLD